MAVTDGDVLKVVLSIAMPNLQVGANVYYWRLDDPVPDSPSAAQILSAINSKLTDMTNQIDQEISDEYNFDTATVEKVEWDGTKWETVENVGQTLIDIDGTQAPDAVPHGCAMVVTARTSRPQTRARKFLPGVYGTGTEDSTLAGTVITALGNYGLAWLGAQSVVGSAELVPAVTSVSGPTAGTLFPLVLAIVSSIIGYQRRRKPGVGS